MSKKLGKIIILSLGISIFLFSISKTDFSFNIRSVQEYKSNFCKNKLIDKNFLDKYTKENSNYTYTPKIKDDINITSLMSIFNASKKLKDEEIISIITNLMPSNSFSLILIIIISSITAGSIYYYCSCFYCNCCLCDNRIEGKKCNYFYLFVSIFLYLIIIILSFMSININIQKGFQTLFCSIEKFGENIINGDDNKIISPRWIGLKSFGENIKNNLVKELQKSLNYQYNLSLQNTLIQKEKNKIFEEGIQVIKSYIYNIRIHNPKKENEQITPYFNENLIDNINLIEKELTIYLNPPIEIINSLDLSLNKLSEVYSQIDKSMEQILNQINKTNELNKLFSNLNDNYFIKMDLFNKINNFDFKNSILIIIIIIAILTLIFSLLTISKYQMKYYSFVGWSCLHLFIVPLIYSGIVLITLGYIITGVYMFFNAQLNLPDKSFIKEQSIKDYINVCYNGNGSLTSFKGEITKYIKETSIINDIYDKNDEVIKNQKNLLEIKNFKSIEKSLNAITVNNILSNSTELMESLNEFNKYINYGDKEKYISENSEIKPYEIFVTSFNKCLEGYKYTKFDDKKNSSINNKLCFVINEWDEENFNSRYMNKNIILSNSNFSKVIENYKKSLFLYIKEVKIIINEYTNKLNEINNDSKKLLKEVNKGIEISINSIKPIVNFLNPITNGMGIFSSLNCNFIHKIINLFFEAIHKELSLELRNLGNNSIYIGLFISISSWFIIIAISRFAITEEEKRRRENILTYVQPLIIGNGEMELKKT